MRSLVQKYSLLVLLVVMTGSLCGCYENTRRGYGLDEMNRHGRNVRKLEDTLAETNGVAIVNMANITADTASQTETWYARFKAAAKAQAAKYND